MKAQHFFKGLSWLLVLNLLIKPVFIFSIDRQVQNIVGHQVYGTYFALFNLCYVLLFIADAGLSNLVLQRLAAKEKINVRQLLKLKLALLLLYTSGCLLVAALSGVKQWSILGYLIFILGFNSLFLFLRSLLAAGQLFKTDALFSVFDKSLLLLLCAGPVYGLFRPMTITLFLQLQLFSILTAVSCLFLVLLRKKELKGGDTAPPKKIAGWVAPFALLLLLMSAHNRLDAFLLERLHPDGAVQAGIYAMAYRLMDAGNMVGFLTASFLVPFLSRNRHDKQLVQQVILLSRHGLLLLSAGATAFVFVFAPWLEAALYQTNHASNSKVFFLCMAALPAYYLIHIYGSALTAMADFKPFLQVVFFSVLVNTLLNCWLIPTHGAVGCCIAALVSQYGCGILLWKISSRRLEISSSAGTAFLYLAVALLSGFLFFAGQKLTSNVWIILSSIVLFAIGILATQRNYIKKVFLPFNK